MGDKVDDRDALDAELAEEQIVFIATHRYLRKRTTQDGRSLRWAKRRGNVELTFV